MVGVVGSSPVAPTKFGKRIKGLVVTPSPSSLAVRKKYGKVDVPCGPAAVAGVIRQPVFQTASASAGHMRLFPASPTGAITGLSSKHPWSAIEDWATVGIGYKADIEIADPGAPFRHVAIPQTSTLAAPIRPISNFRSAGLSATTRSLREPNPRRATRKRPPARHTRRPQ